MTQGRPRDAAIDDAARQACRELLIESGWEGTSLSAVADRAGVSRPALYRRWPTKTQLVFDTLFGWAEDLLPKQLDQTPDEWLRGAVEISFELFNDPAVRAGVPGLLAVLASDEEMRTALWERAGLPAVEIIEAYLPEGGDAERRRALAQAVLGVLAGAPLFLQVFGRETDASTRVVLTTLLQQLGAQEA
ncbi:MAG TPA: TetR/AcrR family transcriptional regulator [Jatrophihabitantaceae bacterium]|nr:TetR/AcrR family transcriptional regulator [Jatrophihabitantaceae bacterium]